MGALRLRGERLIFFDPTQPLVTEGLLKRFGDWIDAKFGESRLTEHEVVQLSASRTKAALVILAGWAASLCARLLVVMFPDVVPAYTRLMSATYYDATSKDFFAVVATVAATLWVVFLGFLALSQQAPLAPDKQALPRDVREVALIYGRSINYWLLLNAIAITICFQTALYFSVISILPSTARWLIAASSIVGILLNGASIGFVSSYSRRTDESIGMLRTRLDTRSARLKAYINVVTQRIDDGDTGQIVELRLQRLKRAQALLTSYQYRMQVEANRLGRQTRYLDDSINSRGLIAAIYTLQLCLGALAGLPSSNITIVLVMISMLLGILISSRCTITLAAMGTAVAR